MGLEQPQPAGTLTLLSPFAVHPSIHPSTYSLIALPYLPLPLATRLAGSFFPASASTPRPPPSPPSLTNLLDSARTTNRTNRINSFLGKSRLPLNEIPCLALPFLPLPLCCGEQQVTITRVSTEKEIVAVQDGP